MVMEGANVVIDGIGTVAEAQNNADGTTTMTNTSGQSYTVPSTSPVVDVGGAGSSGWLLPAAVFAIVLTASR